MNFLEKVKDFISERILYFYLRKNCFYNVNGDQKRFEELRSYILVLPDNVLKLMKKKRLVIQYRKVEQDMINKNIAGFYNYDCNLIAIFDWGSENFSWQVITLFHEIGHFMDYSLGFKDYRSKCDLECYQAYKRELCYFDKYNENSSYYQSNIEEFFAQSFAEYHLFKDFKVRCPLTANYIENKLSEIA